MIIVTDTVASKRSCLMEREDLLLITKQPVERKVKQIVMEDIVAPSHMSIYMRGEVGSITHYYRLAETYLSSFRPEAEKLVLVIDADQAYDLSMTIFLLERLSENPGRIKEIIVMPLIRQNMNNALKARLYAWLKTISIYDIFFNYMGEGSLKILPLDKKIAPAMTCNMVDIASRTSATYYYYSLLLLRFKRLILPIIEIRETLRLLAIRGNMEENLLTYKALYIMIHNILDRAPSELWDIARGGDYTTWIRSSIYHVKRLRNTLEALDNTLARILSSITQPTKYTGHLIPPRDLLKIILSTPGLTEAYRVISTNHGEAIRRQVEELTISDLEPVYHGVVGNTSILRYNTDLFVSKDMINMVKDVKPIPMVLENLASQIIKTSTAPLPVCDDCTQTENYVELSDLKQAYIERIEAPVSTIYPPKIKVNGITIPSEKLHRCGMINYAGLKQSIMVGEEVPCNELITMVKKATE